MDSEKKPNKHLSKFRVNIWVMIDRRLVSSVKFELEHNLHRLCWSHCRVKFLILIRKRAKTNKTASLLSQATVYFSFFFTNLSASSKSKQIFWFPFWSRFYLWLSLLMRKTNHAKNTQQQTGSAFQGQALSLLVCVYMWNLKSHNVIQANRSLGVGSLSPESHPGRALDLSESSDPEEHVLE